MTMLFCTNHLAVATELSDALRWYHDHPNATLLSGGTEVMADVALEEHSPKGFLHIGRVDELRRVSISDERIVLGAGTTMERLTQPDLASASPLLAQVARSIGTPQSRRRGTVGGNLGAGQPDRSLAPALLALGCSVVLQSESRGERHLPLADFLLGRGQTALASDELISSLVIGRCNGFQAFTMVGPRHALVYPTVATALVVNPVERTLALGIGNAAETAIRANQAASLSSHVDWESQTVTHELVQHFGELAAAATSPVDDIQASADYRRHAVAVMARRLLQRAFPSSQ